jgi:phosphatidylcholine synthase
VDYITFVFFPMFLLDAAGRLPRVLALAVVGVVLLSSAYGFAAADAKSPDHFFTGFPSYWNIVVFYLMALRTAPAVNAAVLLVLSGLIFVRTGYVYPSRMPVLRRSTNLLAALWCAAVAWIVWRWPSAPRSIAIGSLAFPVYYFVLSVVLHRRRRPALVA